MNGFQIVALLVLGAAGLATLPAALHGTRRRGAWLRLAVMLLAAAAIFEPEWTTRVARLLGIHNGANMVLYAFVLIFLATTFYFYARQERLQQQITRLVRQQALASATRGPTRNLTPSASEPPADA